MFWGYSSVGGLKLCPLKTYLIIMGYRSKSALSTHSFGQLINWVSMMM
jgi:hypothetical protein